MLYGNQLLTLPEGYLFNFQSNSHANYRQRRAKFIGGIMGLLSWALTVSFFQAFRVLGDHLSGHLDAKQGFSYHGPLWPCWSTLCWGSGKSWQSDTPSNSTLFQCWFFGCPSPPPYALGWVLGISPFFEFLWLHFLSWHPEKGLLKFSAYMLLPTSVMIADAGLEKN